jgi:hypothetical protein
MKLSPSLQWLQSEGVMCATEQDIVKHNESISATSISLHISNSRNEINVYYQWTRYQQECKYKNHVLEPHLLFLITKLCTIYNKVVLHTTENATKAFVFTCITYIHKHAYHCKRNCCHSSQFCDWQRNISIP